MSDAPPIDFDLMCPWCAYNLRGLQDRGRCPECGGVIDVPRWLARDEQRRRKHHPESPLDFSHMGRFDRLCAVPAAGFGIALMVYGILGGLNWASGGAEFESWLAVGALILGWGIFKSVVVAWGRKQPAAPPTDPPTV